MPFLLSYSFAEKRLYPNVLFDFPHATRRDLLKGLRGTPRSFYEAYYPRKTPDIRSKTLIVELKQRYENPL